MNAFLKYAAASLLPRQRKREVKVVRSEREAPLVLRGAEQALAERSKQFARGKRWSTARLKELLAGPWGDQIRILLSFLHHMTIDDSQKLLVLLDELDWFAAADHDCRMNVLSEIDDAIMTLRQCNGYPEIDDALPGEELTIFQFIQRKLNHEESATDRDRNWNARPSHNNQLDR